MNCYLCNSKDHDFNEHRKSRSSIYLLNFKCGMGRHIDKIRSEMFDIFRGMEKLKINMMFVNNANECLDKEEKYSRSETLDEYMKDKKEELSKLEEKYKELMEEKLLFVNELEGMSKTINRILMKNETNLSQVICGICENNIKNVKMICCNKMMCGVCMRRLTRCPYCRYENPELEEIEF